MNRIADYLRELFPPGNKEHRCCPMRANADEQRSISRSRLRMSEKHFTRRLRYLVKLLEKSKIEKRNNKCR